MKKELMDCPYDHADLDLCEKCPICGYENHVYTTEPYCDICGKPHEGFFEALRAFLGGEEEE